jgi:hypothetical protein
LVEWRRLIPDARLQAIDEKAASLPPASPPTRSRALEIAAVGNLQGDLSTIKVPANSNELKRSPIRAVANAVDSATGIRIRISLWR